MNFFSLKNIAFLLLIFPVACSLLPACTIIKKSPAGRPYLVENSIELRGSRFKGADRQAVLDRLKGQLDDSSIVPAKSSFFFFTTIRHPVAYDTGYSAASAVNMRSSMYHLGYYNAEVSFIPDTAGRKVSVKYIVTANTPTVIDTVFYTLKKPDLEALALASEENAQLVKGNPVTKVSVLGEVSRLVDTFRNNGYYKFTAAELRVRGDTTIAALTTISEDPFDQLRLLNEAQQKRDSPTIKLSVTLVKPDDSTKLNKYYINKIYVLSDFRPNDVLSDTTNIKQHSTRNFIIRDHERLFRTALFTRNITLRPGDVFSQEQYYNTLSNLSNLGAWQSVNIRVVENLDLQNKVDLVIELLPAKKFGFEASLEASYSAASSTNVTLGGNLVGFSANLTLLNRNVAKEAIRMTHNLRAGIELNNNNKNAGTGLINSTELTYSNTIAIPRLLLPKRFVAKRKYVTSQTFVNTTFSYNNRFNLFNQQAVNLSFGYSVNSKRGHRVVFRPLNVEYSKLSNVSAAFKSLLDTTPFLKYSYNVTPNFILGSAVSYSALYHNPHHPLSVSKDRTLTLNGEESGVGLIGLIPIAEKYKKHFVKLDAEYKYAVNKTKTAFAFRAFTGVGIPLRGDTSLPFFKQYFGGGSNSMRAWPVRGIGRGSQKLAPFAENIFNDRTGDMQIEFNGEFRHQIARIIPDLLTLRGAVFADIGNIWNLKNSLGPGLDDPAQFKFKNLYRELGLCAGYGFRFDFNYLVLRTDFGFRFKRPETANVNDGWKAPPISFGDAIPKIFSRRYRQWRYENFNFTIGINYPF